VSWKNGRGKQYISPDGQTILCYLCGERQATTDDHVPPQNLFPNNAQFKGFKVPACRDCNNGLAKDDEYLRDVLTMGCINADALQVLREKTIPSMRRPWAQLQRVRKQDRILARTFQAPMNSPGGLHLQPKLAIQFDTERIDRVCARIVRGLYYELAKQPFAKECEIVPKLLSANQVGDRIEELKQLGYPVAGYAGDDMFFYAMWGLLEDRYMTSTWLLRFYNEVTALVFVKGPMYRARAAETSQDDLQDHSDQRDD
jgi:hypothetical protein